MSNLVYEDQRRHNGATRDEWPTDLAPARRSGFDGTVLGVPSALVALGLGAWPGTTWAPIYGGT